jgi:hypothetical protein
MRRGPSFRVLKSLFLRVIVVFIFSYILLWIMLTAATKDRDTRSRFTQTTHPQRKLSWTQQGRNGTSCRRAEGKKYVVDDRGFVCSRSLVNYTTNCCQEGQMENKALPVWKFNCGDCDIESHCCHHYEFCVSCCLSYDVI